MPNPADCQLCPRLAAHLESVRREHPAYFNAPVPAFGDLNARLLIVGLAPGKHGANATGLPFMGDAAGSWLFHTLHARGYSRVDRSAGDEARTALQDCRITNAVRCLPPGNSPKPDEVRNCNTQLREEIDRMRDLRVILALGRVAHEAVLMALGERPVPRFAHGADAVLTSGMRLVSSYHCSRLNVRTGRLTRPMFDAVFDQIDQWLERSPSHHAG